MIGLPPFAGFFSKWYLALGAIQNGQWYLVAVLIVSSLLSAIYFFRIIEKLFMNSYSHNVYYYDGVPETTAVMSFKSGFFNSFTVVCHLDENDAWYVCDECTIVK